MDIGTRVKHLRTEKGISQQKLANAIDVSVDMIRSIEINRAKPSVDTLAKLCDFFDCTADYLLGRTDDHQKSNVTWGRIHEVFNLVAELTDDPPRFKEYIKEKFPDNDDPLTKDEAISFDKIAVDIIKKLDEPD